MAPRTIVASREYPFYCSCLWWNETRFPLQVAKIHSKSNAKSTNEQITYFTILYLSVMHSEASIICALQDRLLILQKVRYKMRWKMVYAAQESYKWCYWMFIIIIISWGSRISIISYKLKFLSSVTCHVSRQCWKRSIDQIRIRD